jgi:uncharacterized lipoprotein
VVSADVESYGAGSPVTVSVVDQREDKTIGSRGGVYKNTSTITIQNNLEEAIYRVAQASLAAQGFNVNSAIENAASLKIIVEKINYQTPEDSLAKKVALEVVLRVEAQMGGEKYIGRYKSNSERLTIVTPSMAKNEKMINDLLSKTLVRLFQDQKLKTFLGNI